MSNVVYAYTSKGRKEKCGKGGVGCVRHPIHLTNGSPKANTWFGVGVIADAMKAYEADGGDSAASVGLADYEAAAEQNEKPKFVFKDLYDRDEADAILAEAAKYKEAANQLQEEHGFMGVREKGLGTNFKVLNAEDGYRKDNRLWFGKCSVCGGHVSNSYHDRAWVHTIRTPIYKEDGTTYGPNGRSTRVSVACPNAL